MNSEALNFGGKKSTLKQCTEFSLIAPEIKDKYLPNRKTCSQLSFLCFSHSIYPAGHTHFPLGLLHILDILWRFQVKSCLGHPAKSKGSVPIFWKFWGKSHPGKMILWALWRSFNSELCKGRSGREKKNRSWFFLPVFLLRHLRCPDTSAPSWKGFSINE